ncbi:MAG: peptidoglycan editing factor PgeF [Pseudomonadales bacterium]|nr:peptidoglycan editing factor PgeF [Gammaproteobacteria bacterium]NNL57734.1 peptidoglycan editing factor PgeF [Pseudomonadales bacterium]
MPAIELLCPVWPAPAHVVAGVTTRVGGNSRAPYASLNLAQHVADQESDVNSNRAQLKRFCRDELCASRRHPNPVQQWYWLQQTHSNRVLDLDLLQQPTQQAPRADAAITSKSQRVCVVLTADCLPILLCDRNGTRVCTIHAGWRGLLNGIVDNAVQAMCKKGEPGGQQSASGQHKASGQLLAWLGPAIGPQHFIVGDDVRRAALHYFSRREHPGHSTQAGTPLACERAFVQLPGPAVASEVKYAADLYQLATLALHRSGVRHIYGGGFCTASDAQRFFSYRRDGTTGRMASFILLNRD